VWAGGTTTYTVRVTNAGPSPVTGAVLTDPAVAGLTKTGVACSSAAGNLCTAAPDIADLEGAGVTLPTLAKDAFYEIEVAVTVDATSGTVTNTATVAPPPGTTDPDLDDNTADDTDDVGPVADLSVTKDDGRTSVPAGGTTTYTVRVTNAGPSPVTGAVLTDPAVAGLTKTGVACSSKAGNVCPPTPPPAAPTIAELESGFALPTLAKDAFYELEVTAKVDATSGTVTNTAMVVPPEGTADPNAAGEVVHDTDTIPEIHSWLDGLPLTGSQTALLVAVAFPLLALGLGLRRIARRRG
ncbi:MAG TPA: hypothetical protein VFW06_10505, partial [Acidimicrobiia bacterium]|nr:hypothetical protein [Acidimicrobiia bacterium]